MGKVVEFPKPAISAADLVGGILREVPWLAVRRAELIAALEPVANMPALTFTLTLPAGLDPQQMQALEREIALIVQTYAMEAMKPLIGALVAKIVGG
jgi:hypothetical protein